MVAMHDEAPGEQQGKFAGVFFRPVLVGNGLGGDFRRLEAKTGSGFRCQRRQDLSGGGIGAVGVQPPQPIRRFSDFPAALKQRGRDGDGVRFKDRFNLA